MPIVSMPTYGSLVQQQQFDPVAALAQQRKIEAQTLANQQQNLANQFTQATQPGSISAEDIKNKYTEPDILSQLGLRNAQTANYTAQTPGIQAESDVKVAQAKPAVTSAGIENDALQSFLQGRMGQPSLSVNQGQPQQAQPQMGTGINLQSPMQVPSSDSTLADTVFGIKPGMNPPASQPQQAQQSASPQTAWQSYLKAANEAALAGQAVQGNPHASLITHDQDLAAANAKRAVIDEITGKVSDVLAQGGNKLNQEKKNAAILSVLKDYPGMISDPDVKEALGFSKPSNTVFNMPYGGAGAMMPPPSVLDNAAKRIADGKSTISEEINKGRFTGATAMQAHDDLVNRVTAINPNFSESDNEAGRAFASNRTTKLALANVENAYGTVAHLKDVYSKLNNTQYPTLNKAILAGKFQTGDVQAAKAEIDKIIGNDELSKAYTQSGGSTDLLRSMSAVLADPNGAPAQQAGQFDEILSGLDRFHKAYESQGGGFIKPMKASAENPIKMAQTPGTTANGNTWK